MTHRGCRGGDGHAGRQKQRQQGDIAHHGRAPSQGHEVVPVVDEHQEGVCTAGQVSGLPQQGLHHGLPVVGQLLRRCMYIYWAPEQISGETWGENMISAARDILQAGLNEQVVHADKVSGMPGSRMSRACIVLDLKISCVARAHAEGLPVWVRNERPSAAHLVVHSPACWSHGRPDGEVVGVRLVCQLHLQQPGRL